MTLHNSNLAKWVTVVFRKDKSEDNHKCYFYYARLNVAFFFKYTCFKHVMSPGQVVFIGKAVFGNYYKVMFLYSYQRGLTPETLCSVSIYHFSKLIIVLFVD